MVGLLAASKEVELDPLSSLNQLAASASALNILPKLEKQDEPLEPCTVLEVVDGLILVRAGRGLVTQDKPGTMVDISEGAKAVLLAWKEDVGVLHLCEGHAEVGDTAQKTEQVMTTASSTAMRGRIINPSGDPIDGQPALPIPGEKKRTFVDSKGMEGRTSTYRSLFTGIQGVDFAVPIGRGQTMLFQGTDPKLDRTHLWPDLLSVRPLPNAPPGPAVNVAVCKTLVEAKKLRQELQARGSWDMCTIVVPSSDGPGARVVALNAAMAFAENFCEKAGEAVVVCELEPMHRVWNVLADFAGKERQAKGILVDPKEDSWVKMEGTILRESIAERRKFWFAFVSRATNNEAGGSLSLLPWVWEQEGGFDIRKRQALEKKLKQIQQIPRISDAAREKLASKVKEEAGLSGLDLESLTDDASLVFSKPGDGIPNWEIEELKSISDGHVILRKMQQEEVWYWSVDPYKSLPRLGTDALHPALISVDAPKLRLKMMQGRDRADLLHDTKGAPNTLDQKKGVELRFLELMLQQPAGKPLSVEQEAARLVITAETDCKPLQQPNMKVLERLTEELLASTAGTHVALELEAHGEISEELFELLTKEVRRWN